LKAMQKLKGIRAEHMLSQERIADMLGISTATYNRKENGKIDFTLPEALKILEVFEVELDRICDDVRKQKTGV